MSKKGRSLREFIEKVHTRHQRLVEDVNGYDDEDFMNECGIKECGDASLTEDLNSSFPVQFLSEDEVRAAAKDVVKGAKVEFGYAKELKLDAKYAQGKFVKKDGQQYPVVKAIKLTRGRGCTGVQYGRTEGAVALHSTQEYQDKLADKIARTGSGFGSNVHDTEAGLENILVTTAKGKKCVLVYPLSTMRAQNTYYISVDGEDWRETNKEEIAQYMSAGEAQKLLDPATTTAKRAQYQANLYNRRGIDAAVSDTMIVSTSTGDKLKLMTSPLNITYVDPLSPFYGIFQFDKETALAATTPVVEPSAEEIADTDPFGQDFPEVG